MFRTIRWKLTISSLLVLVLPLIGFGYFLTFQLWNFYLQQLESELSTKAEIVADDAGPILSPITPDDPMRLAAMVDRWRRYSEMRVTIANENGVIEAATDLSQVGQHVDETTKPGMLEAIAGKRNATVWRSPNFANQEAMYVNLPVRQNGQTVGAIRVAYSLAQIDQGVRYIRQLLLASIVIYAVVLIALVIWLSGSIVRPIEALDRGAQRIAAGDLDHTITVNGTVEVNHLTDTLNQMTERLHHLEGMRRRYVSDVSHELRTPLAAIRGMAETLMEHGGSDPELSARYLPRIVTHTDRLARLATQLLDLAQIESGNLLNALEPVALADAAEGAIHLCGDKAMRKGVRIVLDVPHDLPPVRADGDRLVQVILNLVDNALRYTPDGGTVTVAARVESPESRVESGDTTVQSAIHNAQSAILSISDTGAGIPEEHLPHLFDRFYRVDTARSRTSGGTGLGLSIVQQIVRAHGGEITVQSTVGQGTTFSIRLPLAGSDEQLPALAAVGRDAAPAQYDSGGSNART